MKDNDTRTLTLTDFFIIIAEGELEVHKFAPEEKAAKSFVVLELGIGAGGWHNIL